MQFDDVTLECIAKAIHENYLAEFAPDGPGWAGLSVDLREANLDQARAILDKLASVGAHVVFGPPAVPFAFTAPEVERLARVEHQRWMAQRREKGWIYAFVRRDRHRRHPMIIKWEKLSEVEREKDREAVRRIPDVLERVGLSVVRAGRPTC